MPTDSLTRSGGTASGESATDAWVMVAGYSISDSTPPSDSPADGIYHLTTGRLSTYIVCMERPIAAMREPTYFVLASLLDGPLHGYAIIKRAEDLSGGRVKLATGTLYAALDRLTAEGYVRLVSEEIVNGRARRSYGLTDAGADALRAEAIRMADAASLVIRTRAAANAPRTSRKVRPA